MPEPRVPHPAQARPACQGDEGPEHGDPGPGGRKAGAADTEQRSAAEDGPRLWVFFLDNFFFWSNNCIGLIINDLEEERQALQIENNALQRKMDKSLHIK